MGRPTNTERIILAQLRAERERWVASLRNNWRVCPATLKQHPNYRRSCSECMGKPCAQMLAKGLADDGSALPHCDRPTCGAKNRMGQPCKNKIVPGKHRCKYHGGNSTGPRTLEGKARIAEAQRKRWAKWRSTKGTLVVKATTSD